MITFTIDDKPHRVTHSRLDGPTLLAMAGVDGATHEVRLLVNDTSVRVGGTVYVLEGDAFVTMEARQ